MTRLTFSLCYLMLAMWTVIGMQGAGANPTCVKPSIMNLQTPSAQDSKSHPSKTNEDCFLRKLLSPLRLKNLQINTHIHELADFDSDKFKESIG